MNLVKEQYTNWVYPQPIKDIEYEIRHHGYIDLHSPHDKKQLYFPNKKNLDGSKILIAGCGTNQAAVIAYMNRETSVLGIDISNSSLDNQRKLKEKHKLNNLTLLNIGIEELNNLNEQFDLIICCGVLHHLNNPQEGLSILGRKLREHGVISLMLYGKYARTGVYMLQEVFKLLNLEQKQEDVNLVKATILTLPKWHHLNSYINNANDLNSDSGIVDTFLHTTDRAYTVSEILEFSNTEELEFVTWLDPLFYEINSWIPILHPLKNHLRQLDKFTQWKIAELIGQELGTHRFVVSKKNKYRKINLNKDDWRSLFITLNNRAELNLYPNMMIRREQCRFPLTMDQYKILKSFEIEKNLYLAFKDLKLNKQEHLDFLENMFAIGNLQIRYEYERI